MYDIIIIGSGPAGLSAAVYASRAKLSAVVVEKDYMGSGQIAASEQVDNYLGLPGIGGYELGEKFRTHAEAMGAAFQDGEIQEISKNGDSFMATLDDGTVLESRSIIYAAGTSYRHLEVPGGELLGVSYCATCDGAFYEGKTVAVIGGGDTALGDALYLSGMASKVYLVHRRDSFRGNPMLQEKIRQKENITLVTCAVPEAILGEKRVQQLRFSQKGETRTLDVDGIFVAIGSVPNTQPLQQLCQLDNSGYIVAGEDGKTSLPGLFAAGDVRTKCLRQVVTAVADGAVCVQSVEQFFNGV